jgi:hypothetical protein
VSRTLKKEEDKYERMNEDTKSERRKEEADGQKEKMKG